MNNIVRDYEVKEILLYEDKRTKDKFRIEYQLTYHGNDEFMMDMAKGVNLTRCAR